MTARQAVSTRIAERRAARRRRRAEPPLKLFDGIEWDEHPRPRQQGDLAQLVRWIGRHQWPAQLVLIVGFVTIGYLLLIFGLALGVAIGVVAEMADA